MSAAGRVLALPAFLLSIALFYWSLPLAAITNHVKFMEMRGRRADMYTWARFMTRVFNVRIRKYGTQSMYKAGPAVYLCDKLLALERDRWRSAAQRSTAQHSAAQRSTAQHSAAQRSTAQHSAAQRSTAQHSAAQRSTTQQPAVMLRVQPSPAGRYVLIISRGKENVLSEKQRGVHWGVTVVTAYSEVLATSGKGFEEFATEVQACWDKLWDEVYAARASDLPLLVQDSVPDFDYSPLIRQQQLVTTAASIVILAAVLYATVSLLLAMTAMAGAVMQKPAPEWAAKPGSLQQGKAPTFSRWQGSNSHAPSISLFGYQRSNGIWVQRQQVQPPASNSLSGGCWSNASGTAASTSHMTTSQHQLQQSACSAPAT
ncbi:hypothetical protein QJQ45_001067 [Haematococcus lacustris]|nr:hypothetical protein QJQ45_001067 [Haematococcus lacustris]